MRGGVGGAALAALLLVGVAAAASEPSDWRQIASVHDRQRLRDWRAAWMIGLDEARAGGGAAAIAADPVLYGPDSALIDGAVPAAGDYRCRRIAIGARAGGPAFAVGDWGRCRVEGAGPPLAFTGFDGVQRPVGKIYTDGDRRAIFLGTVLFAEERHPLGYGHAAGRDLAGVVERIGERRWRLVMPYPHFGAALDVIELVPVSAG